jgi:hypothetical protein
MELHTFECKKCKYITNNSQSFERHIETNKHEYIQKYICECGKKYKHRQSLYNHKRKCDFLSDQDFKITKQMFFHLLEQNNELHQKIIEMGTSDINSNNTNNTIVINNTSNSATFNLNFFLNEQCKDAINISDFVNSCKMDLTDLEETGKLGYVEGISRIVMRNLEELGLELRPMHCSDRKRSVLYIKDNNVWVKETNNQEKIKSVIKEIANKNIKQIFEWQKNNPEFANPQSHINDKYLQILSNSMCGATREEETENLNKILKNVIRGIIIDK